jgi:hypothetical protein
MLAALFLAATGTVSQAALLQTLIDGEGTIIDGDKEFSNFVFVKNCLVPSAIGVCSGDASAIEVMPLAGDAVGLAFIGLFSVRSPGGAGMITVGDFFISYDVRVLDPTRLITGVGIRFNGSINGNQSSIDITETAFTLPGGAALGQAVVSNPPLVLNKFMPLSTPVASARVTKDIAMHAGNNTASPGGTNDFFASISLIEQYYEQSGGEIPEPGTMAMAGAALMALGLVRRNRQRI